MKLKTVILLVRFDIIILIQLRQCTVWSMVSIEHTISSYNKEIRNYLNNETHLMRHCPTHRGDFLASCYLSLVRRPVLQGYFF